MHHRADVEHHHVGGPGPPKRGGWIKRDRLAQSRFGIRTEFEDGHDTGWKVGDPSPCGRAKDPTLIRYLMATLEGARIASALGRDAAETLNERQLIEPILCHNGVTLTVNLRHCATKNAAMLLG
jgi:hypothetical protein